jgi:dipeptidase E
MKLLLTSGGITNDTLARELEDLAGKPFGELKIGFIPNAAFGDPSVDKAWLINDMYRLVARGATVAVISLADLTSEEIAAQLEPVDVVFVGGGNTFYLSWLMQQKGLFTLIPRLLETKVYAGISAGSMIATPSLATVSFAIKAGEVRDDLGPEGRSSANTLGLVPFLIRPHLGNHLVEEIKGGVLERIAVQTGKIIYAIDNNCAVKVSDDEISVVGEGEWKLIR